MRTAAAILLGLLLLAGCRHSGKADAAADDESAAPTVTVEVQPVVRAELDDTVEVLGTTQPLKDRIARVTTAVEGRVAEILPAMSDAAEDVQRRPIAHGEMESAETKLFAPDATASSGVDRSAETEAKPLPRKTDDPAPAPAVEGQLVTKQQVIVRLDDSLARATVAKVRGAQAEAQAAMASQDFARPQQLQAAEAALASAKSALDAAEDQIKRLQGIANLVGPAQLADAQTAIDRAKADKHAAEARLAELSTLPAARKAAELKAKVRAAEADLQAAQMQLELSRIRSPIAGRLGRISVFLGQSLPVGTPVATVADLRQIAVEAAIPAKHIRQIQVGQSATIEWGDEAAPATLAGRVTFVGQEIEPGSGSFLALIVADNPEERLRAGLSVRARIIVHHLADALAVPRAAVIEETDEPYVFVAEKKGDRLVARRVPVKLGIRSGDLVQVDGEGIAAGANVVTKGNYFLPDEAVLKIESADEGKTVAENSTTESAAKSKQNKK